MSASFKTGSPVEEVSNDNVVCVRFADGCKRPAIRMFDEKTKKFLFVDETGEITDNVVSWEAGDCQLDRGFVDTCFLPDQYAIVWTWAGDGRIMSYNPLNQQWTSYGQTALPDGTIVGGFSMDVYNDVTNPLLLFQVRGNLYKSSIDNPTALTLVGPANNSAFSGSYPCGAFDPSGRYLIGIGSGSTVGEVDVTTGQVTTIGQLIDVRDGAPLQAGPGDWFFDPSGRWFLMARDTRGATFGVSTGTVLWQIDPSTLEVTRVGNTPSPVGGTGAAWLSGSQYLLSTGSGLVYTYNVNNDPSDPTPGAWTLDFPTAPGRINDLGNQWVVPEPIRVFGFVDKGCPDLSEDCSHCLFTLVQDPLTLEIKCEPFQVVLPGKFGVCEKEANPYVIDPFDSESSPDQLADEVWHTGCSSAGSTKWRRFYDPSGNLKIEYLYGTLTEPTAEKPLGFSWCPCGEVVTTTDTIPFCNFDVDPPVTVYQKQLSDGTVSWFDASGVIAEPVQKEAGECSNLDPLLPVQEQVICFEGRSYIRQVKEQYVEDPATGLPELAQYQIVWFNEDGILFDSGFVLPLDPEPQEPGPYVFGDCVSPYIRTEDVKLCEVDAEFLLLIDSGGAFARYSLFTGKWENVSTLSVASAGGSADYDNFLLYSFVAPDQLVVVDVNTDAQLPSVTLIDGVLKPGVLTNPKTFIAASFRVSDGYLYAQDTAGADAGLYRVNVATGQVDFVTDITGVTGAGVSIAIDNSTDTLIVNGANLAYQVDWVTGVATVWGDPPIQPNGSTFDAAGNFYVTGGPNTYCLPAGLDPLVSDNYVQIIDDWGPGANSLAYYRTVAQKPSCFFRRYGILEDGTREVIGDFNVADDSPRTVVGDVDCCECACGGSGTAPAYGGPSAAEIADALVLAERSSVEGRTHRFIGSAVESLPVAAGQRGNLISISDAGPGLVYFTLDGSPPSNTAGANLGEMSGQYLAAPIRNIDLSLVRFAGSSTASSYTVYYEVYL